MSAQLGNDLVFHIPQARIATQAHTVISLVTDATNAIPEGLKNLILQPGMPIAATVATYRGIARVVVTPGQRFMYPEGALLTVQHMVVDYVLGTTIPVAILMDPHPTVVAEGHLAHPHLALFEEQFTIFVNKKRIQPSLFAPADAHHDTAFGAAIRPQMSGEMIILNPKSAMVPMLIPADRKMCREILEESVFFTTEGRISVSNIPESLIGGLIFGLFGEVYATRSKVNDIYNSLHLHQEKFSPTTDFGTDMVEQSNTREEQEYHGPDDTPLSRRRLPTSAIMTLIWTVCTSLYKNSTDTSIVEATKKRGKTATIIAGEAELEIVVPAPLIKKLRSSAVHVRSILHLLLADFYKPDRIVVLENEAVIEHLSESESDHRMRTFFMTFISGVEVVSFAIIDEFMKTSRKVVAHINSRVLDEYREFLIIHKNLKDWCEANHCPLDAIKILYPDTKLTQLKKCEFLKAVALAWKKEVTKNTPGNTWAQFLSKEKPGMDAASIQAMVSEALNLKRQFTLSNERAEIARSCDIPVNDDGTVVTADVADRLDMAAMFAPFAKRGRFT